jgi:hypothetical protein
VITKKESLQLLSRARNLFCITGVVVGYRFTKKQGPQAEKLLLLKQTEEQGMEQADQCHIDYDYKVLYQQNFMRENLKKD